MWTVRPWYHPGTRSRTRRCRSVGDLGAAQVLLVVGAAAAADFPPEAASKPEYDPERVAVPQVHDGVRERLARVGVPHPDRQAAGASPHGPHGCRCGSSRRRSSTAPRSARPSACRRTNRRTGQRSQCLSWSSAPRSSCRRRWWTRPSVESPSPPPPHAAISAPRLTDPKAARARRRLKLRFMARTILGGPGGARRVAPVSCAALSFDDDIALRSLVDGRYEGEISDEWRTPRGALGGYVMAVMLRGWRRRWRIPGACRGPARGLPAPAQTGADHGRDHCRADGTDPDLGQRPHGAGGQADGPRAGRFLDRHGRARCWPATPMPDVEPPQDRMTSARRGIPDILPPPFVERVVFQHRFGAPMFSGAAPRERWAAGSACVRNARSTARPWCCSPTPVPCALAPAARARPGADHRPHGPLPRATPDCGWSAAGRFRKQPDARRVLRRGRRAGRPTERWSRSRASWGC